MTIDPATEKWLRATASERLGSLARLVAIPSVSSDPDRAGDCQRAAEAIAADLSGAGLEHVFVGETDGPPIVYADWLHAPAGPTVLVYAHYDVQPAGEWAEWTNPPFVPRVDGRRITGRGTADDKGQLHAHVRAVEAVLATQGKLGINLRFLFDGEEEIGSPHLQAWLEANGDLLAADLVVISDTGFLEGNRPAITVGLRGIMAATIDVCGPSTDLHSGVHGGAIQNPALALATILANLRTVDGKVTIPGFYDDVRLVPPEADPPTTEPILEEAAYRSEVGVPALIGEPSYSVRERRSTRPTLDVHSLQSGGSDGARTIIPAHAQATLSCRLVPDQQPLAVFRQLERYIGSLVPAGVRVGVTLTATASPSLIDGRHPAVAAASRAIAEAFEAEPVLVRDGGTIPACSILGATLGVPVVLVGFANPDDNAHAPNEYLVLDNYERGIRAICRLWTELAQVAGLQAVAGERLVAAIAERG